MAVQSRDARTVRGSCTSTLIPNSPEKPLRIWMEVGDRDLLNPNVMRDNMHDWVLANENMAKVLAAKGYHYQFVFARNAGHVRPGGEGCRRCRRRWSMCGGVMGTGNR